MIGLLTGSYADCSNLNKALFNDFFLPFSSKISWMIQPNIIQDTKSFKKKILKDHVRITIDDLVSIDPTTVNSFQIYIYNFSELLDCKFDGDELEEELEPLVTFLPRLINLSNLIINIEESSYNDIKFIYNHEAHMVSILEQFVSLIELAPKQSLRTVTLQTNWNNFIIHPIVENEISLLTTIAQLPHVSFNLHFKSVGGIEALTYLASCSNVHIKCTDFCFGDQLSPKIKTPPSYDNLPHVLTGLFDTCHLTSTIVLTGRVQRDCDLLKIGAQVTTLTLVLPTREQTLSRDDFQTLSQLNFPLVTVIKFIDSFNELPILSYSLLWPRIFPNLINITYFATPSTRCMLNTFIDFQFIFKKRNSILSRTIETQRKIYSNLPYLTVMYKLDIPDPDEFDLALLKL